MTVPITLKIPNAKPYHGVARLVVGGLAARLELSYEDLEDLQLALETVLEQDGYAAGEDVTVELGVGDESVDIRIGPLRGEKLREDLERKEEADTIGLGRLLAAVVEDVSIEERPDGEWLRLVKSIQIATHS